MDCFGTYLTHAQSCDNVRVQRATEWTASVNTLHVPKSVITFVFIMLRNTLGGFGTYFTHARSIPKLWYPLCSKCYGMDCFGTLFTHAQSCDNVHVQSAMEWAASVNTLHMPKSVITFVFIMLRNTMGGFGTYFTHARSIPKLWYPLCSKCYGMDCFGTYFTHAQSCDNVHVQSAMEWAASVNTLHMPKSVITSVFIMLRNTCPNLSCDNVFKVLRNGRLRYILYTRPKHPKAVISFVFKVLRNGLLRYIFYACPKLW